MNQKTPFRGCEKKASPRGCFLIQIFEKKVSPRGCFWIHIFEEKKKAFPIRCFEKFALEGDFEGKKCLVFDWSRASQVCWMCSMLSSSGIDLNVLVACKSRVLG